MRNAPLEKLAADVLDWRAAIDRLLITATESAALPELIGELARADAIARRRLHEDSMFTPPAPQRPDRLLTADEVAPRLGVSVDRVYRDAREERYPFMRRLGANTVRFSEQALDEWMRRGGRPGEE